MKQLKEGLLSKKNIDRINTEFNKANLLCGNIVMFNDNTFGIYLDKDIGKKIKDKHSWDCGSQFFMTCYSNSSRGLCFMRLGFYTDKLVYIHNSYDSDLDIIRIYNGRLNDKQILELSSCNSREFTEKISDLTASMNHIDRK